LMAAKRGHTNAQYNLGLFYDQGIQAPAKSDIPKHLFKGGTRRKR
jgi:TPR repeat protein